MCAVSKSLEVHLRKYRAIFSVSFVNSLQEIHKHTPNTQINTNLKIMIMHSSIPRIAFLAQVCLQKKAKLLKLNKAKRIYWKTTPLTVRVIACVTKQESRLTKKSHNGLYQRHWISTTSCPTGSRAVGLYVGVGNFTLFTYKPVQR